MPNGRKRTSKESPVVVPIKKTTFSRPPYRRLAAEGGGAKGFAYLGAIKALDEAGILKEIEAIAGASAGAIAALVVSTGWPVEKMENYFKKLDFSTLVRGKKGFFSRLKSKCTAVYNLFMHAGLYSTGGFHKLFQDLVEEATTIKGSHGEPDKPGNRNMTFAEWHAFKEEHPERSLKDIYVVACNLNRGGLAETFSYLSEHKDVSIADGVCASMAFPGCFIPPEIKGCKYADGGEQKNCPSDVFEDPPGNFDPTVLSLRLDDIDEIRLFKYGVPPPIREIKSFIACASANAGAILNAQNVSFYNSPYRNQAVFCDTLGTPTLDFDLTPDKQDALIASGYYSVVRYMLGRHPDIAERVYCPATLEKIRQADYPISFAAFLGSTKMGQDHNMIPAPSLVRRSIRGCSNYDEVDSSLFTARKKSTPCYEKWKKLSYMRGKAISSEEYRKHEPEPKKIPGDETRKSLRNRRRTITTAAAVC